MLTLIIQITENYTKNDVMEYFIKLLYINCF